MGLEFDGDNDRIIVNDASFLGGLDALTFSAWIKCSATLPYDIGFFKTNEDYGDDNGIGIRYDASGLYGGGTQIIKCGISINGDDYQTETSNFSQTNDWQHILMTWKSGDNVILIYLDGKEDIPTANVVNGNPFSGPIIGVTDTTDVTKILFGTGAKGSSSSGWQGALEDLRFYNRKLSANEVQTIFSLRGNDNILDGLIFRYLFHELSPNITPAVGQIKDTSIFKRDADSIIGDLRYVSSPVNVNRRKRSTFI